MDTSLLVQKILSGSTYHAARLMRAVDDGEPYVFDVLRQLYPHTGKACILGVTGSPGAGKSTLVDRLVQELRAREKTVGVVAVDPTSPFTGGAILGDRIRMQQHTVDPGVFIRSLATRGALGGLSRSCGDVVRILDAMGFDYVIVETVGVGQDEVEIVKLADATLVVLVPGLGDDVQSIKAGILEIADIFVINKADRDGTDRLEREIRTLVELGEILGHTNQRPQPLVTRTVATRNEGVSALVSLIEQRLSSLSVELLSVSRSRRVTAELSAILEDKLRQRAKQLLSMTSLEPLLRREVDPYTLADSILEPERSKP